MNEPYEMTAKEKETFRRAQAVHAAADTCARCGTTRTHNKDSKGKPFCVPCKVDTSPKDPRLAGWKNGPAIKEDE